MNLLFDFDGTLVDSFQCIMEKAILLADEFNYHKIKVDEIDSLRDLSSDKIIQHLQIPTEKIPHIILQIRAHLVHEMQRLIPVANIHPVLKAFHTIGCPMGIITSNSEENVKLWLTQHHLNSYFKFIQTESNYFSKQSVIEKTLHTYKLDPAQTFYICDETRDVEAANKNNIKAVAVTWGYNTEKILLQSKPAHIARKPEELLDICTNLST